MGQHAEIEGGKVVLEIDLAGLWVGGEHGSTFAEYVADRAALALLKERDAIPELRRRVREITEDEIRAAVKPTIAAALDLAVQQTDGFGAPKGSPTTLRELVLETARKELGEPKDRGYGKSKTTIVEQFVRDEVEKALKAEMQEAVREAKGQVMVAVREQAAAVIQETVERVAAGRGV
jgi:hypothetical protein